MAPQVLQNDGVKFPKDVLLHRSAHQHGSSDVRCKPGIVFDMTWWKTEKELLRFDIVLFFNEN